MSTAEILSLISLISYILAGVCLVLAVFFWFFFQIPSVIGNLSGRTAKKSVERMRQSNIRSGNKSYRSSATNVARGKLTDTMPQTQKPGKAKPAPKAAPKSDPDRPETGLLADHKAVPVTGDETAELHDVSATELLVDEDATAELHVAEAPAKRTGGKKLTMINEVMLIHTNEVI